LPFFPDYSYRTLHPRTVVFFLALTAVVRFSDAQKTEITLDRSKDRKPLTLLFKDKSTGKMIQTINLDSVNPYKKSYASKIPVSLKSQGVKVSRALTSIYVASELQNFIAVSFAYNPFDQDNIPIDDMRESTVIVYNGMGEEIYKLSHLPFDAQAPLISRMVNFWVAFWPNGLRYFHQGYRI
jgi:hypothetical protein